MLGTPVFLHHGSQCQAFYCSQAYCSDDCQTSDISPSISSSSSTRSSPNITCAYGDEVPALVPSALGSALKSYMASNHYSLSSSSASSASWSLHTDDEDDEAIHHFGSRSSDVLDGIYDSSSKSVSSGLSYARRPSGTNNSSTVSHPHRRMCSDSSLRSVQSIPRSVPIYAHSPSDEDENYFGIGSLPEPVVDADDSDLLEQDWYRVKPKYQGNKTSKRRNNRASLPACFSLLQMTSSKDMESSPVSSSSGNTIARPSPPTPRPTFRNTLTQAQFPPTVYSTPRERRREAVNSLGTRQSVNSSAFGSQSGTKLIVLEGSPRVVERPCTDLKGSTEKLVDWPSLSRFPHRGRATLRRNSSPLPKMHVGVEDPALVTAVKDRQEGSRSRSRARTRGRVRVEDLGRDAHSTDAPGFGYGRSGLLDRERGCGAHSMRLP